MSQAWGLYPWFYESSDPRLIHPEDIEKFRDLRPYGKVFQCLGRDENYLVLKYRDVSYRAHPDLYRTIPAPVFDFGCKVRDVTKPERIGFILDIEWHHRDSCHIYYISVNGKRHSKRYFETDLETINE
jgi:hypothetical protein